MSIIDPRTIGIAVITPTGPEYSIFRLSSTGGYLKICELLPGVAILT